MQGGSTLTQQYVKLALIDKAVADNDKEALAAAYDRTFSRKLLELRYAIALEDKMSKDDILERYLNLLLRCWRLWRRGGRSSLLRHHGEGSDAGSGGHARWPGP